MCCGGGWIKTWVVTQKQRQALECAQLQPGGDMSILNFIRKELIEIISGAEAL